MPSGLGPKKKFNQYLEGKIPRSSLTDAEWAIGKQLIQTGVVDSRQADRTCLHIAAEARNIDAIHFCIEHRSVDVNAQDKRGRTPFMLIPGATVELLDKFLSAGMDGHVRAKDGSNLFLASICKNRVDVTKQIAIRFPGIVANVQHDGQNAFHLAAVRTLEDCMLCCELLRDPDAINAKDAKGRTPLTLAASTQLVPESCKNENKKRQYIADRVHILVTHGADVLLPGVDGSTALMVAAKSHLSLTALEYLLDHQPELLALRDRQHRTATHIAAENGNHDGLRVLLQREADLLPAADRIGSVLIAAVRGQSKASAHCISIILTEFGHLVTDEQRTAARSRVHDSVAQHRSPSHLSALNTMRNLLSGDFDHKREDSASPSGGRTGRSAQKRLFTAAEAKLQGDEEEKVQSNPPALGADDADYHGFDDDDDNAGADDSHETFVQDGVFSIPDLLSDVEDSSPADGPSPKRQRFHDVPSSRVPEDIIDLVSDDESETASVPAAGAAGAAQEAAKDNDTSVTAAAAADHQDTGTLLETTLSADERRSVQIRTIGSNLINLAAVRMRYVRGEVALREELNALSVELKELNDAKGTIYRRMDTVVNLCKFILESKFLTAREKTQAEYILQEIKHLVQ